MMSNYQRPNKTKIKNIASDHFFIVILFIQISFSAIQLFMSRSDGTTVWHLESQNCTVESRELTNN